ncbi:hypothetical protein KN63_08915 [Smithella sp. F21]|jgi:hypothetical protein|nr:hypothetical protein KN63_08915 [Smithella sp. F21]
MYVSRILIVGPHDMGSGAMTTDNKVILFADILGFAALTESFPLDVDRCRVGDRPIAYQFGEIFEASRNELAHTFSGFHSSLRGALSLARMNHPLTAITFSDSVFIATTHAYEAVNIAINLFHALLPQKIPMRMGIAYGTFAALRFRSDITVDSGDHAAQFLGTAVVRAHAAETCGIKGLRILIHPSVMPLLDDIHHNPVLTEGRLHPLRHIECSEREQLNKAGVLHEIDYWHLTPTSEAKAWRGLQDMWNKAPLSEVEHYEVTAEAINRMRIAQGREPLKKLHRRTLP